ncbi:MAG: hypothetical protein JJV97_04700 [SAR324 cluster bacterium]|nr:hypothetical protein [SAR324 cluster bacterium]
MSARAVILDLIYIIILILLTPLLLIAGISRADFRWLLARKFIYWKYSPITLNSPHNHHQPVIIIHSASFGEAMLAIKFADLYYATEKQLRIIFLVNTKSGYEFLKNRQSKFNKSLVAVMPFDFSFFIKHTFSKLNIKALIILESDYWPNFLLHMGNKHIPIFAVNARLSLNSFRLYRLLPSLLGHSLTKINKFYSASNASIARLGKLGIAKKSLVHLNSFKIELNTPWRDDELAEEYQLAFNKPLGEKDFLVVVGSLQPSELDFVLQAWHSFRKVADKSFLVIIPRHITKLDEFLASLADKNKNLPPTKIGSLSYVYPNNLLFLNKMGTLKKWYQLANCVFVGGTICSRGGQNFLEPIAAKKYTAIGPNVANFETEKDMLVKVEGIKVVQTPDALVEFLKKAYFSPAQADKVALRGYQEMRKNAGSLNLVVSSIIKQIL